jgi:hypothetical protein
MVIQEVDRVLFSVITEYQWNEYATCKIATAMHSCKQELGWNNYIFDYYRKGSNTDRGGLLRSQDILRHPCWIDLRTGRLVFVGFSTKQGQVLAMGRLGSIQQYECVTPCAAGAAVEWSHKKSCSSAQRIADTERGA